MQERAAGREAGNGEADVSGRPGLGGIVIIRDEDGGGVRAGAG